MKLQEHLDLLGIDTPLFAFITKIPEAVIEKALKGEPIAQVHAEQIMHKLNGKHGLHPIHGLQISDIDGLQVVKPEHLRGKTDSQDLREFKRLS